ncbi:AMP-binding protein [Nocardioides sp. zg-536]|uniref:AMP-binding protein n=1 Tax=Nocardioides faecalis TaxID=2803858 RepID=A0A938Y747_9ACTN|nr:AMP-binding protein [Nocardioides faecalis]MBM9459443.1 AMP-binding protein [Nocardioides faecalis]MBS4751684.1 AMP-binding protein [Nocardioides faecalis]QVI59450.1 AMP-binding protein [Nocardioides faecalis]
MTQTTTAPSRPFTLADVLEVMADTIPDRTAIFTMERTYTFAELDERANRVANHLLEAGIQPGDHVAVHSANRIEWIDAFYGCFKARAVPININYKYKHDELAYLYDNADCVAAFVAPEHVEALGELDTPQLRHCLVLGEEYDAAMAAASPERPAVQRSSDDHYVIYTGGTTGLPKGVTWRQEDLMRAALNASRFGAPMESIEQLAGEAAANENPMVLLACGPMMHGGSQWILGNGHVAGFTVALFTEPHFDPEKILDLVDAAGVVSLTFLGDAMGRPVAETILAHPDRWDLSSLMAVSNGAAPLSEGVREEIRRALPGRFILDTYGSSESGAGGSRMDDGTGDAAGAPKFTFDANAEVFGPDDKPVPVGEVGILARRGAIPLGYHKDPVKTAATFKEIDGVRWSITGDMARREEDGAITVLGRGSVCINTGGEKVNPEEVESVLLRHDDVFDAAVVGTPHERWGQQVTALVQRREGATLSEDALREHCRALISNYKVPKSVLFVDQVPRTPVSKVDYRATAELASQLLDA